MSGAPSEEVVGQLVRDHSGVRIRQNDVLLDPQEQTMPVLAAHLARYLEGQHGDACPTARGLRARSPGSAETFGHQPAAAQVHSDEQERNREFVGERLEVVDDRQSVLVSHVEEMDVVDDDQSSVTREDAVQCLSAKAYALPVFPGCP